MRLKVLSRGSGILSGIVLASLLHGAPGTTRLGCPGALTGLIGRLAYADEARVRDAIHLSANGEAELALVRLDNGKQGSLQVWTAWALLQLGNRLGAFGGPACDRNPHRA